MDKPKMILMCGLSGSGKSTISKELALKYNAVILSTDAIREEIHGNPECQDNPEKIFGILGHRIRKNLKNDRNIIVDATNLTVRNRRSIIHYASNCEKTLICYVVNKPYEQCLIDNINREHPVPEYVLEKQNKRFSMPTYDEGFDKIVVIDTNLLQYSNNKESAQEPEKEEPEL